MNFFILAGDECDEDSDDDGILDIADNCPFVKNPSQEDVDGIVTVFSNLINYL